MPESPDYPDGQSPSGDDYVWLWDISTGKLRKSKVSELPFSEGGGGGGGEVVTNPSPFMVFNNSENYSYDEGTNTVTISDTRLKNRTLYPVLASQYGGGEINPELVTYVPIDPVDDTKGQIIITGFQLDDGQHLSLIVPGNATSSDVTYIQLLADVAELKLLTAPFRKTALGVNGAKVWWIGTVDTIPAGWQECVSMRGVFPMAQDPADDDFKGAIGTTGGLKRVKMKLENLIEHVHKFIKIQTQGSGTTSGYVRGQVQGNDEKYTESAGSANPAPIEIMNPYLIGLWIEFVGI